MSKKKAVSGSTMTLKDFHGGSIPSDLSLPSAPGVTTCPADRAGFHSHLPWGNPMGRSEHRLLRPGVSPAVRNFDDKTSFLSHATRIGQNFDEDERKPLDGSSIPRSTVSDESIYASEARVELKLDPYSVRLAEATTTGLSYARQVLAPASPLPRASEATHVGAGVGVISQNLEGNGNRSSAVTGPHPGVWVGRKEVVGSTESVPLAFSKLAHASALKKVSSGRWQSKESLLQADVKVIHHPEMESGLQFMTDRVGGREHGDATLSKHVDVGLKIEDGFHGADGKFNRAESRPPVTSEAFERPKLKLIPRSKPLEDLEPPPVIDYKQTPEIGRAEASCKSHANVAPARQGVTDTESRNQLSERPKLNLKPRSQPPEQLESIEKERNLFGGARPRELVLKERGIDDIADSDHIPDQTPNRVKHVVSKTEPNSARAIPLYTEKLEHLPLDHRIGKHNHMQRVWGNGNRRNNHETEKHQQQQIQQLEGRDCSPDTWRRQPKLDNHDASGVCDGKVASAFELAQAFSKSISDPKRGDRVSSPGGILGQSQAPFSCLVGQTSRRQINGC